MSKSPLPLECLRIVIQHLYDSNDTFSLATLLRANSFFAHATIPILYCDPYDLVKRLKTSSLGIFYGDDGLPKFHDSRFQRNTTLLTRTLLRQAPPEDITDLIRAICFAKQEFDGENDPWLTAPSPVTTHESTQSSDSSTPVLLYLPHITRLLTSNFPNWGANNARISAYVKKTKFFERSRELNLYDAGNNPNFARRSFDQPLLAQEHNRQLLWALCIPELTKDLTILLSEVPRYLSRVKRFTALEALTIKTDLDLTIEDYYNTKLSPEEKVLEVARKVERERLQEIMVEFVKEHTRIHKGVLLVADFHDQYYSAKSIIPASYEYQQRMVRHLPPLYNPQSLDRPRDFKRFLATSEDINLSYLESYSTLECGSVTNAILNSIPPFLHRCRTLKSIKMVLFGEDQFAWAAQERQKHDAQLARNPDYTSTQSLVPVKEATLQFGGKIIGQPIDSIARGFGSTLESFDIAGWRKFHHTQPEATVFGQGWNLPNLRSLVATTSKRRLTIHPDALAGCPALETITLEDSVNIYPADEIPSWSPACLPRVTRLTLAGTPARLFHPDTLYSTSNLEVLTLAHGADLFKLHDREYDYCDLEIGDEYPDEDEDEDEDGDWNEGPTIPALHPDLGHVLYLSGQPQQQTGPQSTATSLTRARWTWDWHLPHLRELNLCGEFALFFQFRMLRHTPSLAILHLENLLPEGQHERTVTVDELRDTNRSEEGEATGFISLPYLTSFLIVARWTIGPQFWQTLFGKVMLAVKSLREDKCIGYTLKDWLEATTGLKKLEYAGSMLRVEDKAEPLAFGLTPMHLGLCGRIEGNALFYFRYVSKLAPGYEEDDPKAVRIYDPESCQYLRLSDHEKEEEEEEEEEVEVVVVVEKGLVAARIYAPESSNVPEGSNASENCQ
ncbi:hypothetical protein EC991_003339 [Linnemannia zychae]|nr:hypothetical protein EC991_003339 [Linnemannia zychae]